MNALLHIVRRDATLELTLNRPERRNALSRTLIGQLTAALHAAAGDATLRSIVLTGAPPAFCAGLDLREVAEAPAEADEHDTSALLELFETLDGCPQPVIAAVNGPAVAGGAGLVSVCDIVVCGEAARIGYPGIRHGLVAPIVMTYLLRLVGERRARYLLLTGEMRTAEQAVADGLANEVVADTELLVRARHYADLLASFPPAAVAQTKVVLARLRDLRGPELLEEARRLSSAVPLTEEARAGLRRFLGI
jgi:methylglutaconyl-CoA hydratase